MYIYIYLFLVQHDVRLVVSEHGDQLWGGRVAVAEGQGREESVVWGEDKMAAVQGHGELVVVVGTKVRGRVRVLVHD